MIVIDVMWTLCSIDLWLIASTVNRYEVQDINRTGKSNDAHIYESTTRYDCHWCNVDLM